MQTLGLVACYIIGLAIDCFIGRLLVDVAQLVEHLVVIQDVAGSSPVVHPFI